MAHGGTKKVIFAALAGNALISITKLAASVMTGSSAMLSEGIHSLVDTGNQGLLLLGLHKAARKADDVHPLGYGKEIYFWSFVVAILIFAVGAGVSIYEGIEHLKHPVQVTNPMINYVVLALAFVFEGVAWAFAFKEFNKARGRLGYIEAVRESKNPTTFVVLFEDSAAMAGIVVAFLGIWLGQITGWLWLDGAASVLIGVILGVTAWMLARETKDLLIGESATPACQAAVRRLAGSYPGVRNVNEVLTLHMGPEAVLVNLSLDFEDETAAGDIEAAVRELNRRIKDDQPLVKRVFIEIESRQDHAEQRANSK